MGVGYKADYVFSWAHIRRQRDSLSIPELSFLCWPGCECKLFFDWG
jgi:hypothetical protein